MIYLLLIRLIDIMISGDDSCTTIMAIIMVIDVIVVMVVIVNVSILIKNNHYCVLSIVFII
jgi:hypothetical protein